MVCRSIVSTNVHFQDTVRLAKRLMGLHKEILETALFPAEHHGLRRADSSLDEYRHIPKLFETNIK
jgi:dipeptidyl aminopeptidase/acylaminoacyl peptidase